MVKRFKKKKKKKLKDKKTKMKVSYKPFDLLASICEISMIICNDENISFY